MPDSNEKSTEEKKPYLQFEDLARKLLAVPKPELDKAVVQYWKKKKKRKKKDH